MEEPIANTADRNDKHTKEKRERKRSCVGKHTKEEEQIKILRQQVASQEKISTAIEKRTDLANMVGAAN